MNAYFDDDEDVPFVPKKRGRLRSFLLRTFRGDTGAPGVQGAPGTPVKREDLGDLEEFVGASVTFWDYPLVPGREVAVHLWPDGTLRVIAPPKSML